MLEIPTANFQCRIRNGDEGAHVPFFSMGELDHVLCKMTKGRCADNDGFLAEMFKFISWISWHNHKSLILLF